MTMTTKHTPGPWRIGDRAWNDTPPQMQVRTKRGGLVLCDVFGNGAENTWANARLIAAAPELLEALQAVVQDWRADLMLRGASQSEAEAQMDAREGFHLARAAIAKATGE